MVGPSAALLVVVAPHPGLDPLGRIEPVAVPTEPVTDPCPFADEFFDPQLGVALLLGRLELPLCGFSSDG